MINDIGGGDEVMEFIGKTGVTNLDGINIDDSRMKCTWAYYINNRYQFNFIHPKSTFISARYHLAIDYGGPNLDGAGAGTAGANPTDLQQFATFRANYPYQAIEGFQHDNKVARAMTPIPDTNFPTYMKPNQSVFNPSDQKFFIGSDDFTGPYFNPALGPGDQNQEWNLISSNVDLEVPYGFSTPAAVAERLTAQLHQRDGPASNWAVEKVAPVQFKIDADGIILDQVMPGISDKTYQTFPTSTGALFYARVNFGAGGEKGWGCAFEGEKSGSPPVAVPVGTNYQGNQGRVQFWKNTLCENINEWKAHCIWSNCQRKPFVMTDLVIGADPDNQGMYTGPVQQNQFTHEGITYKIGQLGCSGTTTLDTAKEKLGRFFFTNDLTKKATDPLAQNTDASLWDLKKDDVVPTNLILQDFNLDNIVRSYTAGQYVGQKITNADPQSEEYKAGIFINYILGRTDDQATLSSADRIIYLPCPEMIAAKSADVPPYTTMAAIGTGNPSGKSYTIDMDAPIYTDISTSEVQARLYGGSRGNGTKYKVPGYVYMDGGYNSIDAMNNNLVNHKGERVGTNLFPDNVNSLFQTALPSGNKRVLKFYYDKLRKIGDNGGLGIGMIPVFYKPAYATGDNAKLLNVPFMAMVVSTDIDDMPRPCPGEFFGVGTPTLTQNNLGKIVTTQKTSITGYGQNADLTPENYMPYIYCGASDSLVNFDGGYSRFTFSQLHTAVKPGNGVFQNIDQKENSQPTQDSLTAYETESALCTIDGGGDPTGYKDQIAIPRPQPIISAQCGVALIALTAFLNEGKPTEDSTQISLNSYNTQQYTNTLFDKIGFSFEQLMPEYGLPGNEFNRGNYNRYLGFDSVDLFDKQLNMVKPFTTNAYISASIIISMVQGIAVKASDAPTSGASEGPVPAGNMGGLIASQSITNADSDLLIAIAMPQKLDYPYLVVYTDIVRNPLYYGGPDGSQRLSAIAYITRNYASGDYFYSFATGWSYTADQDYIITDITTDIRLPDGTPAPIDKNSSVIYKVQTIKAMPPPPQILGQALLTQAKEDEKQEKLNAKKG